MTIVADLRFALRLLWKDRWFTAAAVTALALGLGVNTTVFTFVNAVLIRGLPFPEPDRIVRVESQSLVNDRDLMGVSHADLQDWQRTVTTFEGLAAWSSASMNLSEASLLPDRFRGAFLTPNTFRLLRQPPLLGRDFADEDARPGAPGVVILGYAAWQTRYGGDPSVIGRAVRVNEVPATIIGVMPEGIRFPQSADLWQALGAAPAEARDNRRLGGWGRLANGVTLQQAEAELATIGRALATQYPDTNKNVTVMQRSFTRQASGGQVRMMFLSLMGAVTFVLLIACANVANLLLVRSMQRAREVALRLALGASRWRILRQLLIESLVLAAFGACGGLALASIGVRAFDRAVVDPGKPFWIVFTMDWTAFAYLALVAIVTGLIVGFAPAWQVSRTSVQAVLKDGARGQVGGSRGRRFASALVVVQIAMTLVLLTGAGLMVRSFLALYGQDTGTNSRAMLTMSLNLAERKYPDTAARYRFFEQLSARVAALPGAAAVTLASHAPLSGAIGRTIEIEGQRAPADRPPTVSAVIIGERYFATLDRALLRGRDFTARDGATGSEALIVNERFAARFFAGEDPIGRRVRFIRDKKPGAWATIVGVSPTVRQAAFREIEPDAVVYVPIRQEPDDHITILARAMADPSTLATPLRQAVREIDPDLPVHSVRTLDAALAESRWVFRLFGTMFTLFALIALVLSAVGIYAVMAYAVTQRRQEIGIRMALGADARAVTVGVLRGGLLQLAIGATLGLAGGYATSGVLNVIIVRTNAADPITFAITLSLLVAVTVAACLVPARRAARVDPLVALRAD